MEPAVSDVWGPVVTHGHIDHVGALPELQSAFPELAIIMHAAEAPYLVAPAQAKYSAVPSDTFTYTLSRLLLQGLVSQPQAPPARTFLLSGLCSPQQHGVFHYGFQGCRYSLAPCVLTW